MSPSVSAVRLLLRTHHCQLGHSIQELLLNAAAAVVLPHGKGFPGTSSKAATDKKAICFATAGEKGIIKVWSAATAQCLHELKGQGGMQAGNYVELALLPGGAGLMAASADCNLHFFDPKVLHAHISRFLMAVSADCNQPFFLDQRYSIWVSTNLLHAWAGLTDATYATDWNSCNACNVWFCTLVCSQHAINRPTGSPRWATDCPVLTDVTPCRKKSWSYASS